MILTPNKLMTKILERRQKLGQISKPNNFDYQQKGKET